MADRFEVHSHGRDGQQQAVGATDDIAEAIRLANAARRQPGVVKTTIFNNEQQRTVNVRTRFTTR